LSEAAAIQQDVLNDTTNNIVATDKSVEANGINMADTDALMKNILEKSAAIENIESEVNTLEDTENALPTIDVNEQGAVCNVCRRYTWRSFTVSFVV